MRLALVRRDLLCTMVKIGKERKGGREGERDGRKECMDYNKKKLVYSSDFKK